MDSTMGQPGGGAAHTATEVDIGEGLKQTQEGYPPRSERVGKIIRKKAYPPKKETPGGMISNVLQGRLEVRPYQDQGVQLVESREAAG